MLASPDVLKRQREIYSINLSGRRKVGAGRQAPLGLQKGVKKNEAVNRSAKPRKRRPQKEVKEQVEEQVKARHQERSSHGEGEIKQRIEETLQTLQQQEAAFRDLDVSTFSRSQTEAWHDALVHLNERTAEMVREVEEKFVDGSQHQAKLVVGQESRIVEVESGSDVHERDEEGREKRRKRDKSTKKKARAQYDSRGWRVQPQTKPPALSKPRSLPSLPEGPTGTSWKIEEDRTRSQLESNKARQEPAPQQLVTPPPALPEDRSLPAPGPGTQSCPALPGRPPPVPQRAPPVDKPVQRAAPVRLKPLKPGTHMSPLLSMLAEPYRHVGLEKSTPVSSGTPSTVAASTPGRPHHQQFIISEVRAQRALGRVKTLQSLLSNADQAEVGDPITGTTGESPSFAKPQDALYRAVMQHGTKMSQPGTTGGSPPSTKLRDELPVPDLQEASVQESSPMRQTMLSGDESPFGATSQSASASPKVRFNVRDETVLPTSARPAFNVSTSKSLSQTSLGSKFTAEEEEQAARDKCQKYRVEVFNKLKDDTDHELHKDNLPKALELIGFRNPHMGWLAEVFNGLTCYNTLSEEEFLMFVESYIARQERAGAELFTQYDADHSGTIDPEELAALLASCGITPMAHVVEETIQEVCDEGADCLTLEQTKRLMEILRIREGFPLNKYQTFIETFHRYNRSKTGEMKTQEVMGALGFLGYTLDAQMVEVACREVDVDGSFTINEREFIVLMRKVHEIMIARSRSAFQKEAKGARCEIRGVHEVLKTLGYLTTKRAIVEAAEDAGISILQSQGIVFDDFWSLLEVFRSREGFTRAEAQGIQSVFNANDADGDGELTVVELAKVLRQLGYVTNCNVQQKLVSEVDIDGSGSIDLNELMKLVRKFNEWEVQKSRTEFEKELTMSQSGTTGESPIKRTLTAGQMRRALTRLGFHERGASSSESETDEDDDSGRGRNAKQIKRRFQRTVSMHSTKSAKKEKRYDIWAFVATANSHNLKRRLFRQETSGIDNAEMENLRAIFDKYDEDSSGEICDKELRVMLENLFPQLATSKESRPHLVRLLKEADETGSGTLDFDDFVRLVNKCHDLRDKELLEREKKAIRDTGFAPEEVQGFRELFMGDVERIHLSFDDLKEMLSSVVPLGHANSKKLEAVAKSLASHDDTGLKVEFPEYLRIMRHLLDTNFAGIEEHARRAAATARTE